MNSELWLVGGIVGSGNIYYALYLRHCGGMAYTR